MKVTSINTPSPHFGAIRYKAAKGSKKDIKKVKDFLNNYVYESSVGSLYEGLIKLAGKKKEDIEKIFEQATSKHPKTREILHNLKDAYLEKRLKKLRKKKQITKKDLNSLENINPKKDLADINATISLKGDNIIIKFKNIKSFILGLPKDIQSKIKKDLKRVEIKTSDLQDKETFRAALKNKYKGLLEPYGENINKVNNNYYRFFEGVVDCDCFLIKGF